MAFTDKEMIKEIKERISSLDVRDNIERRAYEIALASLEAEPVAWTDDEELRDVEQIGLGYLLPCPPDKYADPRRVIPLYRELPAPVVPDEMYWQDAPVEGSSKAAAYATGWNACRAAMLQGKGK
ncbi:hypothetical protein FEK48_11290 [Escherichia sp. E2593]|uniref:hypothetical protein n=1 Tax=unclassified Escherichia TaxID=2608889 RepID=UPI00102A2871|nr:MULTISPECIES: hypothetical protein [unclassified Escherichia]RZN41009.1 hypothetical protein D9738_11355 [Escherichia sp. E10V5]TGC05509.1 hypothetical protein CRG93_24430 [Escherichia sp. E2593]TLI83542.1 hypothetical protein FEK48_11290 [Escherichia sp. E2593]